MSRSSDITRTCWQSAAHFAQGKTLLINSMQNRWPAVAAMCRNLEAFFGCPIHTYLLLTPPGAQGLAAHYDAYEVFVLQIDGVKHWRFYGAARDLPLADDQDEIPRDKLGLPTQEVLLQPGDLLYMPRGHVHEAFTKDGASLHLTVGLRIYRWMDLLQQASPAPAPPTCVSASRCRWACFPTRVPAGAAGEVPGTAPAPLPRAPTWKARSGP